MFPAASVANMCPPEAPASQLKPGPRPFDVSDEDGATSVQLLPSQRRSRFVPPALTQTSDGAVPPMAWTYFVSIGNVVQPAPSRRATPPSPPTQTSRGPEPHSALKR